MKGISKILFYLLFISTISISAQSLNVKAEIDTTAIRIGEQFRLKLSAFFAKPSDQKISWPQIKDTVTSKIEVVSKSKIDTHVVASGQEVLSQEIILTSFDSGYHPIPPFAFSVNNDTANFAETEALLIEVQTIPVDTTAAIRDIKGPLAAPFTWREAVPYIIGGIILVAIIVLIIWLIKRSKRKTPKIEEPVILRSPEEIAQEQIELLEKEKLWQSGRIKEYYIRLSDILRIYTEQRYRIPAMEQTSDELLQALRSIVDEGSRVKLRQILLLSDLVKFAKELPIGIENELSIQNAKDFILETKPQPELKKEGKEQ